MKLAVDCLTLEEVLFRHLEIQTKDIPKSARALENQCACCASGIEGSGFRVGFFLHISAIHARWMLERPAETFHFLGSEVCARARAS